MSEFLKPITNFLYCETPDAWVEAALRPENLPVLLVDHCNCELKAAQTAAQLTRRYAVDQNSGVVLMQWIKPYEDFVYKKQYHTQFPDKQSAMVANLQANRDFEFSAEIIDKMIRLIKEELTHFEQVLDIMNRRGVEYTELSAARYAKTLIKQVRTFEPATLVDKLIIGAFIEARSCERFAKLAPYLDSELGHFYNRLLKSEARHYNDYIELAQKVADGDSSGRINVLKTVECIGKLEAELIQSSDSEFRFHSGVPRYN